jgi:hypothetical protein
MGDFFDTGRKIRAESERLLFSIRRFPAHTESGVISCASTTLVNGIRARRFTSSMASRLGPKK